MLYASASSYIHKKKKMYAHFGCVIKKKKKVFFIVDEKRGELKILQGLISISTDNAICQKNDQNVHRAHINRPIRRY